MSAEVGGILGLTGRTGRLVLIGYATGTSVVAVLNLHGLVDPVLGIVTLALFWAAIITLVVIRAEPLPRRTTFAVLGVVLVGGLLSSDNVRDPANAGYATWPLGALTFLLFVLALRGRRGLAWIGFAALALVLVAVALLAGGEPLTVVNDVVRQAATLLIGTLFGVVLRRATQTMASIQARQVSEAAVVAAAPEPAGRSLVEEARPALERIATGGPFGPDEVRYFVEMVTFLRGGTIQQAASSGARIAEQIRTAEARGVQVSIVDDRGAPLAEADLDRLEATLVPVLAQGARSVAMRIEPVGGDAVATLIVDVDGSYRRLVIPAGVAAR